MAKTSIQWTEMSWNPITGCTKVSQGCKNCYAERIADRFWGNQEVEYGTGYVDYPDFGRVLEPLLRPRKFTDVQCHPERLYDPLHWRKSRRVFVNSMSDLFHERVPDSFIAQIFAIMIIAKVHTYQVLTKRPERMYELLEGNIDKEIEAWQEQFCNERGWCPQDFEWPLSNIWLGVSVEDQKAADERIPWLLKTPAAVRFVSYEPALGPVKFSPYLDPYTVWNDGTTTRGLNWIIAGGETGPGARPAHPDWFRSVRNQCHAAGIPFFFKQWGEWKEVREIDQDTAEKFTKEVDSRSNGDLFFCVGRKCAGRLLDGREWNEYPEAKA